MSHYNVNYSYFKPQTSPELLSSLRMIHVPHVWQLSHFFAYSSEFQYFLRVWGGKILLFLFGKLNFLNTFIVSLSEIWYQKWGKKEKSRDLQVCVQGFASGGCPGERSTSHYSHEVKGAFNLSSTSPQGRAQGCWRVCRRLQDPKDRDAAHHCPSEPARDWA